MTRVRATGEFHFLLETHVTDFVPIYIYMIMIGKKAETPRSDQFNIKKVGIQTNKPLNWHHGGYTCIDFKCLNRRFIPVATKEPFTKTLKCLARF